MWYIHEYGHEMFMYSCGLLKKKGCKKIWNYTNLSKILDQKLTKKTENMGSFSFFVFVLFPQT